MNRSLLNGIGAACLNVAISASALSAVGAAQSYYRTRRGSYSAGRNQYIVDPNIKPISTTSFNQRTVSQQATMTAVGSDFNVTKGQRVRELLIVDESVQDKSLIFNQAQPGVEIVEIKTGQGFNSLLKILGNYSQLDAVHIVSHASAGVLLIGGQAVDQKTFEKNVAAFASINNAIKEGGDLMLYGCDLAKGEEGENFLEIIRENTHVDIAASIDKTGNAKYGGNWELEIQKGDIEARPLPESIAMKDFTGTLQFTGTIDFSQTKNPGDYYGNATVNAEVWTSASQEYALVIDGKDRATELYTGVGSNGQAAFTLNTETEVTLRFSNNESFNPQSIILKNIHSDPHTFTITSDKGGSINVPLSGITGGSNSQVVDLSSFADDITSITINSDKVYIFLDDFAVADVGGAVGVLLSSSPTLTFTANSADITGDNIAQDGEGGSQSISDIDIQVFNITNTSGTLLNSLSWKDNSWLASNDAGYSAITYDNNDGNKGMSIKSVDGSEFRLIQFKYYNWGESTPFTNTIKGYRNGSEVASMTFNGFDADYDPITVSLDASFSNVDDVRLYISAGGYVGDQSATNHSINNIQVTSPVSNAAPTATGIPTDITVTEDVASDVNLSAVTFADADGDVLTVTLAASAGTLAAASGGGVTIGGSGTGTLTLAGTAANINTYLDTPANIKYTGASNANGDNAATLTINTNDGTVNPQLGTVNIDITAVNDAPTVTGLPSDITVTEDVASDVDLSSATFADVDGDALTVTLAASAGTLAATSGGGVTIGGSGTGTLTLAGTAANINTYLNTTSNIQYTSALNANGNNAATLAINVNDGTVNPQLGTVNIDITAVNDAPVASNVAFTGTLEVGQQLTGSYDYSDVESNPESGTTFKWYRYDASSGSTGQTQIGTGSTYTLAAADENKYISFEVTPNDGTDIGTPVESSRQGPVTDPAPDINLKGNSVTIVDGDATPSTTDHTDFGSVAAASGTISRTFTIENTGSLDLTLIEDSGRDFVFISGANASDFTVTTQPNEVTAPAGSTTFIVEFDPSAIGERNAMVNITSDDPDENPYTFAIKGTGLNTAPVITSGTSFSVNENTTTAQTVTATDADGHTLTFSISGGADAALFDINASTGALTFDPVPDFENPGDANTDNIYIVEITVSDGNGGSDTEALNIAINDLNDESPVFTSASSVDVNENETSVITVTATDADAGSTVTFSITGGADQALFSIDGSTGALTFSTAPDHENPTDANTDNDYIVQVTASDGSNTTAQTITVSVQDVNDNSPVFTSANAADVDENTTAVITVAATDADVSSTVSYSISGGADQALFSIDGSTGALTFDNAPDFENPADADTDNDYIVQVTASDGTHTVNQTITVSINDLNDESPVFTSASTASIDENTTAVLTVTATDADAGSSLSFSITGGADQALFSIDASTGELTFDSAPDYENPADANADNDYIVEVTVSDGVNSTGQTITITVDDINDEAPVITASQEFSIDENSANGTVVGTISATDADGPGLQDWTITDGNTDGAFALNISTGQLTVANVNALDWETTAIFTMEVTVSDGVNTSASEEVVIDLDDVNDNHPVFQNTPYNASVAEDAAIGASVFTVEATDADAGVNGQVAYSITGGNTNGDFAINASTGEITTANTLDRNTTSSYSLQITATDRGVGNLTDIATVSITVNDVNDNAPIIQNEPYSASINEDIAIGTAVVTISATDADEGINAEIEYSITDGNSEGKFTIDSNTGEITVAQALDYETTTDYTLELTASDKGIPVLSDVTTVTITVLDVNDNAPEFQGEPYAASIAEDAAVGTALITVNATDEDSGVNAQISYGITNGDSNGDFTIDTNTGEIIVAKSLDRETIASYSLEVTATDGGTPSNSSTSTVAITVTDINDNSPVFTSTPYHAEVAEDAAAGTSVFTVEATDADEGANAEVQYSITGGDVNNAFAIDANTGVVTVNNTLDRETLDSYALEITAADQGAGNLSASTVLNIVVTDVNDNAPVAVDDNFETDEDTELQVAAPGVLANDTDEDLNTTLTAIVVDQPSRGALTLNADGSFTYTPDENYNGSDSFTYQAGDGEFASNTATVNITIYPVNDTPTVSSVGDVAIEINSATQAIEFTVGDIDSDLSSLSVSATADNNTLLPVSGIALSGSGDSYSMVLTPATDETGTTQITITVSDGELETEEVFTLVVYPVNVAPTDIALSNNTFIESIAIGEEVGIFATTDENSDDFHTYLLVSGEGDHHNDLFTIEGNKLITNGEYDYEMAEELSIRVRTTDRWGEVYEKIFSLALIADPELELLIPTAITPNNDGENDTWEIDNISLHQNAVVKVFNRDGREVYGSRGYEKEWDGTYNGNPLPFGTYYFIINLNDSRGRTYKGTVMIIR